MLKILIIYSIIVSILVHSIVLYGIIRIYINSRKEKISDEDRIIQALSNEDILSKADVLLGTKEKDKEPINIETVNLTKEDIDSYFNNPIIKKCLDALETIYIDSDVFHNDFYVYVFDPTKQKYDDIGIKYLKKNEGDLDYHSNIEKNYDELCQRVASLTKNIENDKIKKEKQNVLMNKHVDYCLNYCKSLVFSDDIEFCKSEIKKTYYQYQKFNNDFTLPFDQEKIINFYHKHIFEKVLKDEKITKGIFENIIKSKIKKKKKGD